MSVSSAVIVRSETSSVVSNVAEAPLSIDVQISRILALQLSSTIRETRDFSGSSIKDVLTHFLEAVLTLQTSVTVSSSLNHLLTAPRSDLFD